MKSPLASVLFASVLSLGAAAEAATLYTSGLDMGSGSLVCRITNVSAAPLTGVDVVVRDGNGSVLDSLLDQTIAAGATIGLASPPEAGFARCVFANVKKARVRANATVGKGPQGADGVVVEAR